MTIDKAKLKALAEAASKEREANRQMALKGVFFPSDVSISAMRLHSGPEVILALLAEIDQLKAALDMESAELAWSDSDGREIQAERDKLRAELAGLRTGYDAQNSVIEDYKSGQDRYEQIIEDMKVENKAMAKALGDVMEQVDGNIRETVRDCVNGHDDVQDIYGYCDAIEGIVGAAMAKEASHE